MDTKDSAPAPFNPIARLKLKPASVVRETPIEPLGGSEPRRSRRKTSCIQGLIVSERLAQPLHCVVRDISATGAGLELVRPEDKKAFEAEPMLPDDFTLRFRLEKTEVDCRVMWKTGMKIGVRFLSLHRQT